MKGNLWLSVVLVLASCGGQEAARSDRGAAEPAEDTSGAIEEPLESWSRDPVSAASSAQGISVLRDIRAARHDGFDRLVVEFNDDILPGYHVGYSEEEPTQCGSGFPMDIAGEAVIEVRLEPARGFTDDGRATLDHGRRPLDLPAVREAQVSCDYEAMFTILLGVNARTGFRVQTLTAPARLVIEIQHPQN